MLEPRTQLSLLQKGNHKIKITRNTDVNLNKIKHVQISQSKRAITLPIRKPSVIGDLASRDQRMKIDNLMDDEEGIIKERIRWKEPSSRRLKITSIKTLTPHRERSSKSQLKV